MAGGSVSLKSLKFMISAEPARASLLTWEWMTTYEKSPSGEELRAAFERDFPESSSQKNFDCIRWPLCSFNSPEGRRFRYLVAFFQNSRHTGNRRLLPFQIWMYGYADWGLRNQESCDGCALFYRVQRGALFVLIFFEGRLCHWIEESGYETLILVEKRLAEIGGFLKADPLLSRHPKYVTIPIDGRSLRDFSRRMFFRRAARDPFWANLDLRRTIPAKRKRSVWNLHLAMLFMLAALLFSFVLNLTDNSFFGQEKWPLIRDVDAPELSLPLLVFQEQEERGGERVLLPGSAHFRKANHCKMASLKIQGVVADKLFLSGGRTFAIGDSVGSFVVQAIAKNGASLACGDSIVFVGVR